MLGTGNGKCLGRRERTKRAEWCRGLESLGGRFGDAAENFRWCWVTVQVCSLLLPSPRGSVPLHKRCGEGGEGKDEPIPLFPPWRIAPHTAPQLEPNPWAEVDPAVQGDRGVRSDRSLGGLDSRSPFLPAERTGKSRQKSQNCGRWCRS